MVKQNRIKCLGGVVEDKGPLPQKGHKLTILSLKTILQMYDFTRNRRVKIPSSGSTTPSPTLSPGTSSNVTNVYSSPWSICRSRHLSLLSNRHKLHRFHIFPKRGASSAATSPFPSLEKSHDAEKRDDQAKLEELAYDDNFGLNDKAVNWSDKKNNSNMTVSMLEFDKASIVLEKMLEKCKTYLPVLQSDGKCHYLTPFKESDGEKDSEYEKSHLKKFDTT
uniref:Uncharacterized protein n=1 Tax=Romanomermis culicivorax TaxID=13658 RepID=A0A915HUB7_ROMCU